MSSETGYDAHPELPELYDYIPMYNSRGDVNFYVDLLWRNAKVVHNLRTMDNVLARKARIIKARAANILAIDDCDALAFAGKSAITQIWATVVCKLLISFWR